MLVIVVALILLSAVIAQVAYESFEKRNHLILTLSGIVLFLYATLRSSSVGADTERYIVRYIQNSGYNFTQLWEWVISGLKDPGYYLFSWGFSKVFTNPQWWLAFVAAVYIMSVFWLIKNNSNHPVISVLTFIALGFFLFSLTGLRQTIAMALAICSIKFIEERKLVKFLLIVIIASSFHASAVVFLIAYPLSKLKIGFKHILGFIVAGVLFFGFQAQVRAIIQLLFGENRLANYAEKTTTLTASGFIIQLAIFLFCAFYYRSKNDEDNDKEYNLLMNLSFIGLCFQMYASMIAEIFRMSMYFSIVNIVLIPMAVSREEDISLRKIELMALLMILLLFTFRNGIPDYAFFWSTT